MNFFSDQENNKKRIMDRIKNMEEREELQEPMGCPHFPEMEKLISGQVTPEERERIMGHALQCRQCMDYLAVLSIGLDFEDRQLKFMAFLENYEGAVTPIFPIERSGREKLLEGKKSIPITETETYLSSDGESIYVLKEITEEEERYVTLTCAPSHRIEVYSGEGDLLFSAESGQRIPWKDEGFAVFDGKYVLVVSFGG